MVTKLTNELLLALASKTQLLYLLFWSGVAKKEGRGYYSPSCQLCWETRSFCFKGKQQLYLWECQRSPRHRRGVLVVNHEYTFLDTTHLANEMVPTVEHICVIHTMCVAIAIVTNHQNSFFFIYFKFLFLGQIYILYWKEKKKVC